MLEGGGVEKEKGFYLVPGYSHIMQVYEIPVYLCLAYPTPTHS
jgi:hypothetical protein